MLRGRPLPVAAPRLRFPSVMLFNAAKRPKRGAEKATYSPGADSRPPSPVTVPIRAVPG